MFLRCLSFRVQVLCNSLVINLDISVLLVKVFKFFILDVSFILEALVLGLDVTLNFRDVLLSLEEGILAEVFQELSILSIDALFLSFLVLLTLSNDSTMLTQKHLVPVFFIFDLFFLDHLGIFEFLKHLLVLRELFQSGLLCIDVVILLFLQFIS